MGQKKKGKTGGGLPNLSQIRKHCKVKTQASQVAAAPQSEYYTTSFNTKFTRLLEKKTRRRTTEPREEDATSVLITILLFIVGGRGEDPGSV